MNGYERTAKFLAGEKVDRPPFMPLVIDWIAVQAGLGQEEFVYDPIKRANAYIEICDKFDIDCILPDSDFFEQLEDFGAKPILADSGYHIDTILDCADDVDDLPTPTFAPGTRMGNRVVTIQEIAKQRGGQKFIIGTCIDPFTEYCNARGMEDALCELMDEDELEDALKGIRFFHENGLKFIKAQMEAGANGIQIVAPNCSLISPDMYDEYIRPLHTEMVDLVQSMGGITRLHICGDTNRLMPYSLATGTNVIDADVQVDMALTASRLADNQYICGNLSPAGDILQGDPKDFPALVRKIYEDTNNRTIISGGCDIPPATSAENMIALCDAVKALAE